MPLNIAVSATVYMNNRDISDWCTRVKIGTPDRFLEQEFEISTAAWHLFDPTARYDIYASYDPASPREESVIRQGWVLPDQQLVAAVERGAMPEVTIRGKSWSSVAFRRSGHETMLFSPWGFHDFGRLRRVLDNYDGPIGRVRYMNYFTRIDQVVVRLGMEAWLGVSWSLPHYPTGPIIVPPGKRYWDAMLDLVEPFAPEIRFNEHGNSVVFGDSLRSHYGTSSTVMPGDLVRRITAHPVKKNSVRRVVMKVPGWH
jgi:hypothetical protein